MRIRSARQNDAVAIARVRALAVTASTYYAESVDADAEARDFLPRIAGYLAGSYHPRHALAERDLEHGAVPLDAHWLHWCDIGRDVGRPEPLSREP